MGAAGVPGLRFGPSVAGLGTVCRPAAAWADGRSAATPVPLATTAWRFRCPKGSDLILQAHFHLTGKAETEVSTVGIYFADEGSRAHAHGRTGAGGVRHRRGMHIPAGEKEYAIKDSFTLPVDMRVYSAGAHAHYLAKNMKMVAILPDGKTQPLLWIPDWDFAWQDRYRLKDPIVLPEGHAHRRGDQLRQFQRKSAPAEQSAEGGLVG